MIDFRRWVLHMRLSTLQRLGFFDGCVYYIGLLLFVTPLGLVAIPHFLWVGSFRGDNFAAKPINVVFTPFSRGSLSEFSFLLSRGFFYPRKKLVLVFPF